MGLFRKRDDWRLSKIMSREGALKGSLLVNLAPAVSKRKHPWRIYIRHSFEGRPLPTEAEFDRFNQFEEALLAILVKNSLGEHVGTMTVEGKRDWIVYCSTGQQAAELIFRELGDSGVDMEVQRDPGGDSIANFEI